MRKQKPQARRRLILDEAIRMLGEHGFNGLTVQALAERCEISNAGLLYYFGSKEELLLAVLDEFELRESEVLTPLVIAAESPTNEPGEALTSIQRLLDEMVARFAQRPELARLLFVLQTEALDRTHVAHDWFHKREQMTLDLYVSLLDRLVAEPLSSSRRIVAAMQGLVQHWLRQDMTFDLLAEWRGLSGLVLTRSEAARPKRRLRKADVRRTET